MRVIINSDILHSEGLRFKFAQARLAEFGRHCAAAKATLVIPRTAALEDSRHQGELREKKVAQLTDAAELLRGWGQTVAEFDADAAVRSVPIATLLRNEGAEVVEVDPTIDDYRNAEVRAAMHAPPLPPGSPSDEMRDLVIWALAIRLARESGDVMLLSADIVHSGPLGQAEAESVNLIRAKDLDEAASALGQHTESGQLAIRVLTPVWTALRDSGIPLPDRVEVKRLADLQFVADHAGHASGSMSVVVDTAKGPLAGHIDATQSGPGQISVSLTHVRHQGKQWPEGERRLLVEGSLPVISAPPFDERLEQLKHALGETR